MASSCVFVVEKTLRNRPSFHPIISLKLIADNMRVRKEKARLGVEAGSLTRSNIDGLSLFLHGMPAARKVLGCQEFAAKVHMNL
jgi:hypothetical protein